MGIYPFMDIQPTRYEALIACCKKAGSISQLGRDLDIPQSTMSRIVNQSKQLPAEYVLRAEALYGVSRHHLRPDIYPVRELHHSHRFNGVDRRANRVPFNQIDFSKGAPA